MSYDKWKEPSKPNLVLLILSLNKILGIPNPFLGNLCIEARVQDQPMHVVFHISHKNQASMNAVLRQ